MNDFDSSTTTPDRELVREYLDRRSEASFQKLYRRHSPRLFQLALRLVAWREEEAEEILQETWLRAARRLESFRWESSLATWLTGISINVHRDLGRRARTRRREVLTDLTSEDDARPVGWEPRVVPDPVLEMDLEQVLAGLPDGYREVLVLHDLEGHTHQEIADMLAIEVGTSKSQLFHARRAMRRALDPNREAAG